MKRHLIIAVAITFSCAVALGFYQNTSVSATVPGIITLISSNSAGVQSNTATAQVTSISGDGRYVAFTSVANDLVSGDTNGARDIFVKDTSTNSTTRVSVSTSGSQANGASFKPKLSYDGRYVVFESDATNLTANTGTASKNIYRHDLISHITELVSVTPSGTLTGINSMDPNINADGRFVVFVSGAKTLWGGSGSGMWQVVVRDMVRGTNEVVSLNHNSGAHGNDTVYEPSLSCDGGTVSFSSYATNLVTGDTNAKEDIFVVTRAGGEYTRNITINGDNFSSSSKLSCDGNSVTFTSAATNLVSGDTNNQADIFKFNLVDQSMTLVSKSSSGALSNLGASHYPDISGDGRYIAYVSQSTNLVSGDTNGFPDVFVHDTINGTTERLSVNASLAESNGGSQELTMSSNGKYVVFQSLGTNMIPSDSNGTSDLIMAATGY